MDINLEQTWGKILCEEFEKEYFHKLSDFVSSQYESSVVYPPQKDIFSAFNLCSFNSLKVVIIGQDPYHNPNQAHGLCFSVNDDEKFPPSLKNIFKEIESDLNIPIPNSGNLSHWATQGVLLINATLTVNAYSPNSHSKKGWEKFTDSVIKKISDQKEGVVFFLWGAYAQKKGAFISNEKHLVLKSVHPSPLSSHRGFFGNKHFSKCNDYLKSIGKEPIKW